MRCAHIQVCRKQKGMGIDMYVEMKGINKNFGNYEAAKDISFRVDEGHLAALLGPSGSGKTTILRMIAGLEQQDSGDVIVDGNVVNHIPAKERGIGFVFQNYALFRHMTVFENIAFGLRVQKKGKKEIRERVMELVGLEGMHKRYPHQLSGGQRQRVAFARALAPRPRLLLLDEPFAAIDAKVRKELRVWLKEMIARVGITSLFVTHDQEEAVAVADEIMIINEGRLEQMGKPVEIYKKPKTSFVAQFIGTSAVLDDFGGFKGFEEVPKGRKAIVRPEFVEAFKNDNEKFHSLIPAAEKGVITDISFRGSTLELTLEVNGVSLTTNRSLERRHVEIGEEMCVLIYRAYILEEDDTTVYKNQMLKGVDVEAL